jgi:plasmid stabilization system protein ParE
VSRIVLLPKARADALEAYRWYEEQRPGLGDEFRDQPDEALRRARDAPLAYAVVYRDLRRVLLHRFPYAVFYRVMPRTIAVVGVIHGRKHPREWRRRV